MLSQLDSVARGGLLSSHYPVPLFPMTIARIIYGVILLVSLSIGGSVMLSLWGAKPHRQVIFLLLDAARPDRFSSYGYERKTTPNIDSLAETGVIFTNHFSQATATREALPSLLYSRYYFAPIFPYSSSVPLTKPDDLFRGRDHESISLPKLLAQAGFHTAAISAHVWLRKDTAFAAEFDELHDLLTVFPGDRDYPPAHLVIDYTISWLKKNLHRDYFLYVHLMDTHFPHFFEADAKEYFGDANPPRGHFDVNGRPLNIYRPLSGEEREYLDALYDGSLRYTDRQVGRLLKFLKKRKRLQNTLVVITADHGEFLMERPGLFEHGGYWFDYTARTPLIISYPAKLKNHRVEILSEGVDVHPTILGLLGLSAPDGKKVDGRNLLSGVPPHQLAEQYAFSRSGIRSPHYKCLFDQEDDVLLSDQEPAVSSLSGRLFDLRADPGESHNVWSSAPTVVQTLLRAYRTRMRAAYQRYTDAVTHEQPATSFAIAANQLEIKSTIPKLKLDPSGDLFLQVQQAIHHCAQSDTSSDWTQLDNWALYFLMAPPRADPLEVEVTLPNGPYVVTAGLSGQVAVMVEGLQTPFVLQGSPVDTTQFLTLNDVAIGRIEITNERFRATVRPRGTDQCVLLRHFGFAPARSADSAETIDEPQRERLRGLGYLH